MFGSYSPFVQFAASETTHLKSQTESILFGVWTGEGKFFVKTHK